MPTNYVIWDGTSERFVLTEGFQKETFTLSAPIIAAGKVTVAVDIAKPERVIVHARGFQPMRNSLQSSAGNFRVDGRDIYFHEPGLAGLEPPVNTIIDVYYETSTQGDNLKENPEIKAYAVYDANTHRFRVAVWLHENGVTTTPNTANVHVSNYTSALFSLTGISTISNNTLFEESTIAPLAPNELYLARCEVFTDTHTYRQTIPITISETVTPTPATDIANAVWAVNRDDADDANTMGELLNEMHIASTGKYVISFADKTLTIFDRDNTTPLYIYDLKNKDSNPSTVNIYERIPQ